MPEATTNSIIDVEFIRFFFPAPVEEEIAIRWARRLAKLVDGHVLELRPETTLAEMLAWAATRHVEPIDFAVVFEPELRKDFAAFLGDCEHATFREMVQHFAAWFG